MKIGKRKINFWQLTFIFTILTLFTLLLSWGQTPLTFQKPEMMADTMGNMMASMHLQNATLSSLLQPGQAHMKMSENHHNIAFSLKVVHYLTTATVLLLLPIITAGTIFLTIVWLGR